MEHYITLGTHLRNYDLWFAKYVDLLTSSLGDKSSLFQGALSLVVLIAPLLIAIAIILAIAHMISPVLALVLGIAVLWVCFAPTALQDALDKHSRKDANIAETEQQIRSNGATVLDKAAPFPRAVTELIFSQANERFFGVMFWFLVLGPIGAVLYRLVAWLQANSAQYQSRFYAGYAENINQLYTVLAWVPVRLAALSYTLTGNFTASFDAWKKDLFKADATKMLAETGIASLGVKGNEANIEENRKAQALVYRGLLIWLAVAFLLMVSELFIMI